MATSIVNGIEVQMTAQEEADLLADQRAATIREQQREAVNQNMKNQFIAILQSCVGVRADQLTNTQVRAIAIYDAEKNLGLLDKSNFTVKPLAEWVK